MNIDLLLDGTSDDLELEALMARVREAAGINQTARKPPPAEQGAPADGSAAPTPDLGDLLAAQVAWNERTTKSLALIVECLLGMQEAWQQLDAYVRAERARTRASARPKRGRPRVARARPGRSSKTKKGRSR